MDRVKVQRILWSCIALMAVVVTTGEANVGSEARWREFFAEREFGEDPYFFFAEGGAGRTGCPALRRLSFVGADADGARLAVINEGGAAATVRSVCRVRFAQLRGEPHVGALPDGRVMWVLSAGGPSTER